MVAIPSAPTGARLLRATAATYGVLLGPEDGSFPALTDEVDYLDLMRISRSLGAERMDSISLTWDLSLSGDRIVDTQTPVGHKRIVDVYVMAPPWPGITALVPTRLAWGAISEQGLYVDSSREAVEVTTRIDPWMIGKPVTGYWVNDDNLQKVFVNCPLVFNPVRDGRVYGNMSSTTSSEPFGSDLEGAIVRWWVFPESFQSAAAVATQGSRTAEKWTLPRIVHALCWLLNQNQTYVKNPDFTSLEEDLKIDGVNASEIVQNLEIEVGTFLPDALDQVLTPYGFWWKLTHNSATFPNPGSALEFGKKGSGYHYTPRMARPGQQVTRLNTTMPDFWMNMSIADLTNRIEGATEKKIAESTFILWSGFSKMPIEPTLTELNKRDEIRNGHQYRMFVLNEGGDWTNVRPEITTHYNLDTILGVNDVNDDARLVPPKRRKFLPALSLVNRASDDVENDKVSAGRQKIGDNGFELQFKRKWDDDGVPTEDEWKTVDWDFEVLEDQCGIRLTGQVEPELYRTIKDYPTHQALRITASIQGDFAVHKVAERQDTSPNGQDVTSVLDLGEKYGLRLVHAGSRFYEERHPLIISYPADNQIDITGFNDDFAPEPGSTIIIRDSEGNDGSYTVESYAADIITIEETIDNNLTPNGTVGLWTEEVDDSGSLQNYLEKLRDIDDAADVSSSLKVDHIDTGVGLGYIVKEVTGRNLQLTGQDPDGASPRPLTIVGLNYEFSNGQETELLLDNDTAERSNFARQT